MTRLTALVTTFTKMALYIVASGKMIPSTVVE